MEIREIKQNTGILNKFGITPLAYWPNWEVYHRQINDKDESHRWELETISFTNRELQLTIDTWIFKTRINKSLATASSITLYVTVANWVAI